jgi:hypothetical protein
MPHFGPAARGQFSANKASLAFARAYSPSCVGREHLRAQAPGVERLGWGQSGLRPRSVDEIGELRGFPLYPRHVRGAVSPMIAGRPEPSTLDAPLRSWRR